MRRGHILGITLLAPALVTGCPESTLPVLEPTADVALAKSGAGIHYVPLKGDLVWTEVNVLPDPCPESSLRIGLAGSGTISHLGRTTVVQSHCFDPLTGEYTAGVMTLTAANGDQLFATYAGERSPEGQPEVQFTIAGGTGRFDGASGGGVLSVEIISSDLVLGTLDGVISTVGSGRRQSP